MRGIICSCLFLFVLGWKVTAAIRNKIVKEKEPVTLRCAQSVEGDVTWSRKSDGTKVDILTTGDRDIRHIHDPHKRYSSQSDKTLFITKAAFSDAGIYFCNDEAAVILTVIPPGISNTTVKEKESVILRCAHPVEGDVTWSRETDGTKVNILTTGDGEIRNNDQYTQYISLGDKSLYIVRAAFSDAGIYYCNNEAAVRLTVIPSGKTTPTTTVKTTTTAPTLPPTTTTAPPPPIDTTTTKKPRKKSGRKKDKTPTTTTVKTTTTAPTMMTTTTTLPTTSTPTTTLPTTSTPTTPAPITPAQTTEAPTVLRIVVPVLIFLLLLLLLIIIIYVARRRRKQGSEVKNHVYDEIGLRDGFVLQTTNDGSNQNDPTYSTIPDLLPMARKLDTFQPIESPYSLIEDTFIGGTNKGSTQPIDSTYFLLEKPRELQNNNDQYL